MHGSERRYKKGQMSKLNRNTLVKAIYAYEKELLNDAKTADGSPMAEAYKTDALLIGLIGFYAERGYFARAYKLYWDLDTLLREGFTVPMIRLLASLSRTEIMRTMDKCRYTRAVAGTQ